jgi:FkbM family methyltransferase
MGFKFAKIIHAISLRVPQAYALRSGLRVFANTKQQNSLFWSTFTSKEYLSLMPAIIKSGIRPVVFVDCGAATGYVTMLVHHLIKAGVLEWELKKTVCIEPSSFNAEVLQVNLSQNAIAAEMVFGVAGKTEGEVSFFESKRNPWSSSVNKRFHAGKPATRPYYNLEPLLQSECFLKIDIEGSEFEFINTYKDKLSNVQGLIIEWHNEMGNVAEAEKEIFNRGFSLEKTSLDKDNRRVSLYLRKQR